MRSNDVITISHSDLMKRTDYSCWAVITLPMKSCRCVGNSNNEAGWIKLRSTAASSCTLGHKWQSGTKSLGRSVSAIPQAASLQVRSTPLSQVSKSKRAVQCSNFDLFILYFQPLCRPLSRLYSTVFLRSTASFRVQIINVATTFRNPSAYRVWRL